MISMRPNSRRCDDNPKPTIVATQMILFTLSSTEMRVSPSLSSCSVIPTSFITTLMPAVEKPLCLHLQHSQHSAYVNTSLQTSKMAKIKMTKDAIASIIFGTFALVFMIGIIIL